MRVLLVADVVGGVRTFTRELVRELIARDVEVDLALLGEDRDREFECLGTRSCEVRDLRLEWMQDPWDDVHETGLWIEELCELHQPDVVHMNTFAPLPGRDVAVVLTVHSCVLTWWRAVHRCDAPADWDRYRALARRALDRADLLAVPTGALLDDLRAVYQRLPPTRVIPNGRSIPADDTAACHRERLVLSVGRIWDEAKNAALLTQASAAIDGRVVLVGPGDDAPERCAQGIARDNRVKRLGPLSEAGVLSWLSRAAVFAEPARYEPFGLAALEAALCGCALVLGDIPSLREVWGDAAAFVSPDDPESLAHAVNGLLADPARRSQAARAAHAVALRFSPAATADSYLDSYRQLTAGVIAA